MCGIAGYSARSSALPSLDQLPRAMLLGIEERGRDASGLAWRELDQVWTLKANVAGSKLLESADEDSHPPKDAQTLLVHTRWATLGSPKENVNNHPVENHGVVGIHNGVITNHRDVFALLDAETNGAAVRHGQVDSEAIFALLGWRYHLGLTVGEALELLEGSYAIAWFEHDDEPDVIHLARGIGSPLIVGHTAKGSLMFASTETALKTAALAGGFRLTKVSAIPEGSYLKVKAGRIVDMETFTPLDYAYSPPNYSRASRPAVGKRKKGKRVFVPSVRNVPLCADDDRPFGSLTDEEWEEYLDMRFGPVESNQEATNG